MKSEDEPIRVSVSHNAELESILMKMDDLKIHATLYFTDVPGMTKRESLETTNYAKYLCRTFPAIVDARVFPIVDFEPAAPWTENPSKYGLPFQSKNVQGFLSGAFQAGDLVGFPGILRCRMLEIGRERMNRDVAAVEWGWRPRHN